MNRHNQKKYSSTLPKLSKITIILLVLGFFIIGSIGLAKLYFLSSRKRTARPTSVTPGPSLLIQRGSFTPLLPQLGGVNFEATTSPSSPRSGLAILPTEEPTSLVKRGQAIVKSITSERAVPILMYHYIRDYSNTRDQMGINLSVSPETFVKQLEELKQAGYTTLTFKDLSASLPTKPIILTFDDGYVDAYGAALPALQHAEMKGVFYIVTDFLDKPNYMTTEQVHLLDKAGMEIGSHTLDHHDLSKASLSDQQREIFQSKKQLEQLLGKPVIAFCYPSGKYTLRTVDIVKQAGYTSATTTKPGVATLHDFTSDQYELKRVRVTNTTDLAKVLHL